MVLKESPDPVISYNCTMYSFYEFLLIIDYHGHKYSCNVCFRVKYEYSSSSSSGNGHRPNPSRPTIPQGYFGVFWGSQIQMFGEAVKLLDRLAPHLVHVCGFVWEWT